MRRESSTTRGRREGGATSGPRRTTQDEAVPVLDAALKAELKRLALLFLISAITLVLVVAYAVIKLIATDLVPGIVWLMWQASIFGGCVATYFYGLYVTGRARAWVWFGLCLIPVAGSVPASVAYSWIRRGELETQVLEEEERRRTRDGRRGRG